MGRYRTGSNSFWNFTRTHSPALSILAAQVLPAAGGDPRTSSA
jgi:hypothetical protein